jgi:multidrug resistance efflux pump
MSNSMKPFWRIVFQLKEYYPVIVAYSICISVLTLATPISVQSLVNTFSFGPYFQPIFILSVILLGLLSILGVVKSLQYLLVEYLQRKLYAKVSASIGRAYFIGDEVGCRDIDNKSNRYFDVILIYKNLAFLATDGISLILQTILGLILISLYHPVFIIFGVLIVFSILLPLYLFTKNALDSSVRESTSKYEVADHFIELADHRRKDRTYTEKLEETDDHISSFLQNRAEHFRLVFLQNIIYVGLYAFLNALLLGLGGYLVINNQLSIGQLVAAEIVVNAILSNFLYARKYLEAFYDMYAATKKVSVFYDYIDEKKAKNLLEEKKQSLLFSRSQEPYHSEFKSVQTVYTPRNYKSLLKKFAFAIVSVAVVLAITPWVQFSRGYGTVLAYNPNNRIQQVTATVSGVIEEWLVQEGEVVKKGQPIVRVVDNDPNYLKRLEANRDAAIAKFEAAKAASDTARLNFHRQEQLVEEGLSSSKEFEQSKIKYKELQAKEAEAVATLAKAEVDLSRQQQQVVTAPRDGQILRVLLGSGTINVKAGEPLVDFVPDTTDNAVELFLDGNDLPLVYKGRKVRLQFEGWPAIQFSGWPSVAIGSFGGIVSMVDPSVAPDGTFRVLVQPDPEDPVEWPDETFLRQGARALGIVMLEQVSIGYEFWRQINGFPKALNKTPANVRAIKMKKKK